MKKMFGFGNRRLNCTQLVLLLSCSWFLFCDVIGSEEGQNSTGITCFKCQSCSGPSTYSGQQDAILSDYIPSESSLKNPVDLSSEEKRSAVFGLNVASCPTEDDKTETTVTVHECVRIYFTVTNYDTPDYTKLATCTLMGRLEDLTSSTISAEIEAYGADDTLKDLLKGKTEENDRKVDAIVEACKTENCNAALKGDDTEILIGCGTKGDTKFDTAAVTNTRNLLCADIQKKLPSVATCAKGTKTDDVTTDATKACSFYINITLLQLSGIDETILKAVVKESIAAVQRANSGDVLAQNLTVGATPAATKTVTLKGSIPLPEDAVNLLKKDATKEQDTEKKLSERMCPEISANIDTTKCEADLDVSQLKRARRSTSTSVSVTLMFNIVMASTEDANNDDFEKNYATAVGSVREDSTFADELKTAIGTASNIDLSKMPTTVSVTIGEESSSMTVMINLLMVILSPIIAIKVYQF